MLVEPGDVVQIDGGLVIVTSVKGDKASVAPVSDFKGKSPHALKNGINAQITNNRLFERRGESGLADFLKGSSEDKSQKAKGKTKLELGDQIYYRGQSCTVFEVEPDCAWIGSPDGQTWKDDRWFNEHFFKDCLGHQIIRLTPEEREANLKNFIALRKSPQGESENSDENKPHIEVMKSAKTKKSTSTKTTTKARKSTKATIITAAATAAESKAKVAKGSFSGSSKFIRSLVDAGKDLDAVVSSMKEKYPSMPLRMVKERFENQSSLAAAAAAKEAK